MPDEGKSQPIFPGFSSPRYTQVPDPIFDELLPDLTNSELKVLLYIVRRTFGFGKDSDNISLKQLSSGIVTADGRQLDRGTGLHKSSVTAALLSLRQRGILVRTKNRDEIRGNTPTTYRLRMAGEPLDAGEEPPDLPAISPLSDLPDKGVGQDRLGGASRADQTSMSDDEDKDMSSGHDKSLTGRHDTQETVNQQTVEQETSRNIEDSNNTSQKLSMVDARTELTAYAEDFAREFGDEAKLSSTISRLVNLYRKSDIDDVYEFIDVMLAARAKTKEFSSSVKKSATNDDGWGRKNKMPYFFAVLTDMLGMKTETREAS